QLRELQIEQQQVRQRLCRIQQVLERLDAVVEHGDVVGDFLLLERTQGEELIVGVVLDEHDQVSGHRVSLGTHARRMCEHRVTQGDWVTGPVYRGLYTDG